MRFKAITAVPHPDGNRIDLTWIHPEPVAFPHVRVVRSSRTHPTLADQTLLQAGRRGVVGDIVAESADLTYTANDQGERVYRLTDAGLHGETVYYYTIFPYQFNPRQALFDPYNTATAMATSPFGMGDEMMRHLPAIYHRYDAETAVDGEDGQLASFLTLTGQQLDQFLSYAQAMVNLHNVERVDGRLFPLLAEWIGWQTNYRVGVDIQRNEIRFAPHIYKTIGIIPTVEAAIKRVLGWESQTKEFIHNILVANNPEILNLWSAERDQVGNWILNTTPLSLDFAYHGRPTITRAPDGTYWLFYHTRRNERWDIWYKQLFTFAFNDGDLVAAFLRDLRAREISATVQTAFAGNGFSISLDPVINALEAETETTGRWFIIDDDNEITYTVHWRDGQIFIDHWTPSRPLTIDSAIALTPTASFHNDSLLVFWEEYDFAAETWQIQYKVRSSDGRWQESQPFQDPAAPNPQRRAPTVLTINDRIWLFWTEFNGSRWQMMYQDFANITSLVPTAPNLVDNDVNYTLLTTPTVRYHPVDDALWLAWSQRSGVGRRHIVYQIKGSLTPGLNDWSAIVPVTDPPPVDFDQTEPMLEINASNQVELFWSANRDRSWSIWHSVFVNDGGEVWSGATAVTGNPYTERTPVPIFLENRLLLIYRANAAVPYSSPLYGATTTLDNRYAGSTSVDTRNVTKITLREQYEDFQAYTYDTGREEDDFYSANTVGIYLDPKTEDEAIIFRSRKLIRDILQRFLPIGVRVVFIIPVISRDWVYTYDFPEIEPQRRIGEMYYDETIPETYPDLEDRYDDNLVGWIWIYSWSTDTPDGRSVVVEAGTVMHRQYRTWHTGISTGE